MTKEQYEYALNSLYKYVEIDIHHEWDRNVIHLNQAICESAYETLKICINENTKYKTLEQELKLYKKAFEICYEAVDIDTPSGSNYECIFAYDAFPLTSNQEEVAIVKKAAELLNKEVEE